MRELGPPVKALVDRLGTSTLRHLGFTEPSIAFVRRDLSAWVRARKRAGLGRPLLSGCAVVWTAPGIAELLPVDVPGARGRELTVEVASSVVSPGTERAFFLRLPNTATGYPFTPGYSAAGTVLSAGSSARYRTGERVAVRNAGHASVVTVPESAAHAVPAGVTLEDASLVQLGVICGQAVRRAMIADGQDVAIVGAGLIGLLCARLARAGGAGPITFVATSRAKEAAALASGATRLLVVAPDREQIGSLGASVVIEATGDPSAVLTAVEAAGDGARIVLAGSSRGTTSELPIDVVRSRGLRLVGAHVDTLALEARATGGDKHAPEASAFLDLLESGRLRVDDLVQERIDPREAGRFYRRLAASHDVIGARFDWTMLPRDERVGRGWLRAPDLTARGTDHGRPRTVAHDAGRPRALAVATRTSKPLRIGLLGCGDISPLNAAAIGAAPNTTLVACFDPVPELAQDVASAHGAVACPSSDALIERTDVDAVLLSVPHHLHAPLGIAAASAGKHVVVEKPLAENLAAARSLVDAAAHAGVTLSVCFPQRYEPAVVEARRLLDAGVIGMLSGTSLTLVMDKPPSYWGGGYSGRAHTSWRRSREKAGGGVLIMNLSHYVDLVRHLTGSEVDWVAGQLESEDSTSEVEDTVSIALRYENGAVGSVLGAAAVRGATPRTELRLWGRDGQISIEPTLLVYTLRAVPGVRPGRWQRLAPAGTSGREEYFRRLATAIEHGRPPEITGWDGLAVQAFIEATYRSADTGHPVDPRSLLGSAA